MAKLNTNYFMDFNNNQWKDSLDAIYNGDIVEISEDVYDHFLGCVPPLIQEGPAFISSEASLHNENGQAVYIACIKKKDKYYAQHGTSEEFKKHYLFKF